MRRIAGFGGLRAGMTNIEATVHRSSGRWVASEVERSGGGGSTAVTTTKTTTTTIDA